jgi:hypothetical protein
MIVILKCGVHPSKSPTDPSTHETRQESGRREQTETVHAISAGAKNPGDQRKHKRFSIGFGDWLVYGEW